MECVCGESAQPHKWSASQSQIESPLVLARLSRFFGGKIPGWQSRRELPNPRPTSYRLAADTASELGRIDRKLIEVREVQFRGVPLLLDWFHHRSRILIIWILKMFKIHEFYWILKIPTEFHFWTLTETPNSEKSDSNQCYSESESATAHCSHSTVFQHSSQPQCSPV